VVTDTEMKRSASCRLCEQIGTCQMHGRVEFCTSMQTTLPSALIVGTGEYVSGVVNFGQSGSDKVCSMHRPNSFLNFVESWCRCTCAL
jgi:hypothetical protein